MPAVDTALNNRLARNEGALVDKIATTTIPTSIWNKLIVKEAWQDGMADIHTNVTVEKNLAANVDVWQQLSPTSVPASAVLAADVVPWGTTTRNFSMVGKAIESIDISVEAGRNSYLVQQQIAAMYKVLRKNIAYIWKRKGMIGYYEACANKCVVAPGRPTAVDHTPAIAPTGKLGQKFLNSIYQDLIGENAEEDGGSIGMVNSRPQFILVTDAITSDDILREDSTNEAFLYSQRVPELLAPLGVDRGFRGFFHTIEKLPRRFTFDGAWHEVAPYETVAAASGYKAVLSDAYKQAPYTESLVFLPTVMSLVVPGSIGSFGSATTFQVQKYIGEIVWNNIKDRVSNPDGTIGQYRATMASGLKTNSPQFGFAIRHLRCPDDLGLTGCTDSEGGSSGDLGSGDFFGV